MPVSGLYTMVFGVNQVARPLLHALEIDHRSVPRFRDCFLFHDGQSIVIYTRTGGGNREEYRSQNDAMKFHKYFLRDEDDSYDSTYALFHFSIPEEIAEDCAELVKKGYGVNPPLRWQRTIEELQKL
jgi:hypothetical protein